MRTEPKTIVYTALLGGYDRLHVPTVPAEDVRFLCFTDTPAAVPSPWLAVAEPVVEDEDRRIRQARFIKTHPHTLLGPHTTSVWIDANLELTADPRHLAEYLGLLDIATFAYPPTWGHRDCIYQEAKACCERGKDSIQMISQHVDRYRRADYPEHNGLAETSIVVRRNSDAAARANDLWWSEICAGSRRDQLSFDYVLWRLGLRYAVLPGCRRDNPFTQFHPHRISIHPALHDQADRHV